MRALQGSPAFGPSPQQASPAFPAQYPSPYTPVQTNGGMTEMISAIMPIFILMMLMMMMKPMMAAAS